MCGVGSGRAAWDEAGLGGVRMLVGVGWVGGCKSEGPPVQGRLLMPPPPDG